MRLLLTPMLLAGLPLAAATCDSLTSLKLQNVTITSAQTDAKGVCRVQATIKPSSDSDIKVEVRMPAAASWNGKFMAVGNGGWTGSITDAGLNTGVDKGYATAMTDTGHNGGSASFALGHPEKVIDFGYRAVHETVIMAKAAVKEFYGSAPKLSYWNGCSAGGRQGLVEAQRYPDDFDGIVAGASVINWTGRAAQAVWVAQATHKDDASAIPAAKFAAIHQAALDACDMNDGVKDGVIENPAKCKFDPAVLECKGADAPTCLTPAQVASVRAIYSPVTNPRTKQQYFPGHVPGSEQGWNTMAGANIFGIGSDEFKYVVFGDEKWDYKTMNFDADMEKALKADVINGLNPDLSKFIAHGGKLIQYHGYADPQNAPNVSTEYYDSVAKKLGAAKLGDNYRLFMVPGMAHCGGGDGPNTFDMISALENWVEKKQAPDSIVASKMQGQNVVRTRPLCPYPQVAVYKGTGSTDEAANFSCKVQ